MAPLLLPRTLSAALVVVLAGGVALAPACVHDADAADAETRREPDQAHPAHPKAPARKIERTTTLSEALLFETPAGGGHHHHHHARRDVPEPGAAPDGGDLSTDGGPVGADGGPDDEGHSEGSGAAGHEGHAP